MDKVEKFKEFIDKLDSDYVDEYNKFNKIRNPSWEDWDEHRKVDGYGTAVKKVWFKFYKLFYPSLLLDTPKEKRDNIKEEINSIKYRLKTREEDVKKVKVDYSIDIKKLDKEKRELLSKLKKYRDAHNQDVHAPGEKQ